jgi:hypothetical protein
MEILFKNNMKKLKLKIEKERAEKGIEKNSVESIINDGNAFQRGN